MSPSPSSSPSALAVRLGRSAPIIAVIGLLLAIFVSAPLGIVIAAVGVALGVYAAIVGGRGGGPRPPRA